MITPKELIAKQESIQEKIFDLAKRFGLATEGDNGTDAIPDGVADCKEYLNLKSPKVAWVLKEPYDDFQEDGKTPKGGGWLLYEGFYGDSKEWTKIITWQRIIYTMYGLRNGLHYQDMDYIRDNLKMADVMGSTVILNLSKMPAGTTSNYTFAQNYEKYWAHVLEEQIDLYNPDVVVFGNTFSICWPLFVPEDAKPIDIISKGGRPFMNVYRNNGRLLLDAYHPGIRSNVKLYINSIIDTINKHYSK